jgi:hypothetical protein
MLHEKSSPCFRIERAVGVVIKKEDKKGDTSLTHSPTRSFIHFSSCCFQLQRQEKENVY